MPETGLIVFWLAMFLLVYTHAGYPLVMFLLAHVRGSRLDHDFVGEPSRLSCSVILCVHNEQERIEARLRNLVSLEWPGPWELVVVCDGCTDRTEERIREIRPDAKLILFSTHKGKAAGLNAAATASSAEVLVFCDVRQSFSQDAILHLVTPFSQPEIGAVTGLLDIAASEQGGGRGIDAYWQMERALRTWEGIHDSAVGCTGAIYAIRKSLFRPIPEDTILDDVVIPMQVVMQNKRVVVAPRARAFDPQPLSPQREKQRKMRTLAGNYQMLFRHPEWMFPWSCRIWWQVISHKYLRLAVPWLLIAALVSSMLLAAHPFYGLCLAGQLLTYSLGLGGLAFPRLRAPAFTLPAGFLVLQFANVSALLRYLAGADRLKTLWVQPNSKIVAATVEETPHA